MKNRNLRIIFFCCLFSAVLFVTEAYASELKTVKVPSVASASERVIQYDEYEITYGWRMFENLYRNQDGTFTTIDCSEEGNVTVTFYDQNFQQTGQKKLPAELPMFGGFFHGNTYNYLVFGQDNMEEDDTKEVIRVVKYDQGFNRVSVAAIRNCYTCVPFDFGSCRMAEDRNHVTVHTTRTRYLTDDGLRHQSQLTIVINTDTMTVENDLGKFQGNHVSHSFNQFVLYDGEIPVLLDHGDAYPRAVVLHQPYVNKWGDTSYQEVNLMDIPGPTGYNWTGVSVGGFVQSRGLYLAAINTVNQNAVSYAADGSFHHTLDSKERDVVLLSCSKDMDTGSVQQKALTNYYQTKTTTGVPYLVTLGENRYVLLWQEFTRNEGEDVWGYDYGQWDVRYVVINGNAELLTDAILLPNARLSEYCQPIADGNNVVWYAYDQTGNRTFYCLAISNTVLESQEPEIQSVQAADGLVTVAVSGKFPAESPLLAVGAYQPDGKFIQMSILEVVASQIPVQLSTEPGVIVRAFLLDNSYRPLCAPKEEIVK